jgi:hypothetical protein
VHSELDHLERDSSAYRLDLLGEVDRGHPPFAQLPLHAVSPPEGRVQAGDGIPFVVGLGFESRENLTAGRDDECIRNDRVNVHGLLDVLQLELAEWGHRDIALILDLVMSLRGDQDATRRAQRLDSSGDIHAVAVGALGVERDVTLVNADP